MDPSLPLLSVFLFLPILQDFKNSWEQKAASTNNVTIDYSSLAVNKIVTIHMA
jgi:hypothetical protein